MGRIKYSLENNGDVISLENIVPKGFFKRKGATGLSAVAPTVVSMREGAGPGARWRATRRASRTIDMPITMVRENADLLESDMRRLVRLMSDTLAVPRIVATYPNGERFSTEFHYQAGAEVQDGVDTNGRSWADWLVTLICPDPYWTAEDPVPYVLRAANVGRGLIKATSFTKFKMSSSQAIGKFELENLGDVEAFPVWTINGPGDEFSATRDSDGALLKYAAPIALGETLTINTRTKTVVNQTGANKYGNLAVSPKLFSVQPGYTTITVMLSNATADSIVSMFFLPRREFVF